MDALLWRAKTGDALVPVPAKGADDADDVVKVHLAVGHDVQAGRFLVLNGQASRVVVGLGMGTFLKATRMSRPSSCWVNQPGRGYEPIIVVGRTVSTTFIAMPATPFDAGDVGRVDLRYAKNRSNKPHDSTRITADDQ